MDDETVSLNTPLSTEAHARFRRALGKLSWLAQTRQEISIYVSMLSQGQAAPKAKREKALRSFLRFMAQDMGVCQTFPSKEIPSGEDAVHVFTDASFAPMKSLGRRSITGVCIFWRQCLLKGFSKTQQAVTLSSCEAELAAIQCGVQEAVGMTRTLSFVERRLSSEVASCVLCLLRPVRPRMFPTGSRIFCSRTRVCSQS